LGGFVGLAEDQQRFVVGAPRALQIALLEDRICQEVGGDSLVATIAFGALDRSRFGEKRSRLVEALAEAGDDPELTEAHAFEAAVAEGAMNLESGTRARLGLVHQATLPADDTEETLHLTFERFVASRARRCERFFEITLRPHRSTALTFHFCATRRRRASDSGSPAFCHRERVVDQTKKRVERTARREERLQNENEGDGALEVRLEAMLVRGDQVVSLHRKTGPACGTSSPSSDHDQAIAPRNVACRWVTSRRSVRSHSRRCARRSRSWGSESIEAREAASSMARGIPSRRATISVTTSRSAAVTSARRPA
jgi:hypothetical protein